jgi:hypothetical protein
MATYSKSLIFVTDAPSVWTNPAAASTSFFGFNSSKIPVVLTASQARTQIGLSSADAVTFATEILSGNGAASTPPLAMTGTWFTGGSATTTKPALLIEPSGTTSTNWNTSGTGLGLNAPSGFAGNLIDAQVANTRKFSISSGGSVRSEQSDTTAFICGNASGGFSISGRGQLDCTADGVWRFRNNAGTGLTAIVLGTADTSGTRIAKSSTAFSLELGDGSAKAALASGTHTVTGNVLPEANNTRDIGSASFNFRTVYCTNVYAVNEGRFGYMGVLNGGTFTAWVYASALNTMDFANGAGSAGPTIQPIVTATGSFGASGKRWAQLWLDKAITAGGTTGAQTINKVRGTVNLAAAATSLVVTNSLVVDANTKVHVSVCTNDATCKSAVAVSGTGQFTIYPGAAPTGEVSVSFEVMQ